LQELTLKKIYITSSLRINEASHIMNKEISKWTKMHWIYLDQTCPNFWNTLAHINHKWFYALSFLCFLYHYISNQLVYCKYKQNASFGRKGTRKKVDSKARWIFIFLDHLEEDTWICMKHNWLESLKLGTREKKKKYLPYTHMWDHKKLEWTGMYT